MSRCSCHPPHPHSRLLLVPGYISNSGSARACGVPTFPGLLGPGRRCPTPANPAALPPDLERSGSRRAGQLAVALRGRLWAEGKARLARTALGLESAERGSSPPWPLAACAILGTTPGLSEVRYLSPDGFS